MARWRGHDNWKGEPWGSVNDGAQLARRRPGSASQKLDSSHVEASDYDHSELRQDNSRRRSRTHNAPGSARVPMPPTVPPLPHHYRECERAKRGRDDQDDDAEDYHYAKSRSRSQSGAAPGSARDPMPPRTMPLGHLFREGRRSERNRENRDVYAEESHKAKSRSRSQTPAAPGSARVDNQTSSQSDRVALASAQREAEDAHRLWLDRKYKKRAWKRQARNHETENPDPLYPDDLQQRSWHELLARAP